MRPRPGSRHVCRPSPNTCSASAPNFRAWTGSRLWSSRTVISRRSSATPQTRNSWPEPVPPRSSWAAAAVWPETSASKRATMRPRSPWPKWLCCRRCASRRHCVTGPRMRLGLVELPGREPLKAMVTGRGSFSPMAIPAALRSPTSATPRACHCRSCSPGVGSRTQPLIQRGAELRPWQ